MPKDGSTQINLCPRYLEKQGKKRGHLKKNGWNSGMSESYVFDSHAVLAYQFEE